VDVARDEHDDPPAIVLDRFALLQVRPPRAGALGMVPPVVLDDQPCFRPAQVIAAARDPVGVQ